MRFNECFNNSAIILTEGSVGLRMVYEFDLVPDRHIMHASHIYTAAGRRALGNIYGEYLQVAQDFSLPIALMTNTRRANRERVYGSPFRNKNVMSDYAAFLREITAKYKCDAYIGGYMGCKGDGYTGAGKLNPEEAEDFHEWQVESFLSAEVDFLMASLMPDIGEATGMAAAIEKHGFTYIVSFMVRENGTVIDGHTIHDAIHIIDSSTVKKPLCYMTNCVHPRILMHALRSNDTPLVRSRFKGIQANAAYLPPEELDKSSATISSCAADLAKEMLELNNEFHLKINGGCCGTDASHIRAFAKELC